MTVKLLTEHDLEFQSLVGGCTGSSESTLVKMPHCWKSHVTAHMITLPFLWDPNIVLYRESILLGYRNIRTSIVKCKSTGPTFFLKYEYMFMILNLFPK